jgi:4-methyl-5(b-hydroxyethyl)-thiazole monophosphate biosynthesis
MAMRKKTKILVLLGEDFEIIECVIPVDIWRYAGLKVTILSCAGSLRIRSTQGITILADDSLRDAAVDSDVLFFPGGPGIGMLRKNPLVIQKVQAYAQEKKLIAAICAAPLLLQDAGVMQGHCFTAYPCKELPLADLSQPVVWDRLILTGRDPGAVFPFALQLLKVIDYPEYHMRRIIQGMGLEKFWRLRDD